MDFKIRIAGKNIMIHSVYSSIYLECVDFLEESIDPDFEIYTDNEQISNEYERLRKNQEIDYSLQTIETFLVQKLIAESMLSYDTILMHGAVIAVDNKAYMFVAPSVTGKSTHIQKWLRNAQGSFVVNGDKPLVILDKNRAYACGTPWNGKERLGNNAIVPLHSIVFMERSEDNTIEAVPYKSVFSLLLEQTYQPMSFDNMRKRLELLLRLKDCVSFYKFCFNNYKEDAFRTSFEALTYNDI